MSEEKKARSVEDIRQEYSNLCTKAGHIQYQLKVWKDDLDLLNDQLKELNLEAAKAAQAEQAAKDAAAAAAATPVAAEQPAQE